jgi:prepilin-type N-terminal cleavage/methylation domain-containing protein
MRTLNVRSVTGGRGHCTAFTLVELLVVIGVIAVLVAMLLPALNKARFSAMDIACKSNMRQIGMGLQMYQNKYGQLMRSETNPVSPDYSANTHHALASIGGSPEWVRLGTIFSGGVFDAAACRVFFCPIYDQSPAAPPPPYAPYFYYRKEWVLTQIQNVQVSYSLRDFTQPSQLQSLRAYYVRGTPPAHTLVLSTTGLRQRRTIVSDLCEFSANTHGGAYEKHRYFAHNAKHGYNLLFTDGSVDHIPLSDILRVFGPEVTPLTNIAGREHFANMDYLFGSR